MPTYVVRGYPRGSQLTPAEMRVLARVVEGESNPEIASVLGLQPKTVSNVVSNILSKLGARSRTQAAVIAVRTNLLP